MRMKTLAPDGRILSMEHSPDRLLGPWAFMLWVYGQRGVFRLHTGASGSTELVEKHTGRYARLTVREASLGGRRILSYEDGEAGGTTFLSLGPHHEVSTFVPGLGVPPEVFVDMLKPLAIDDSPDGVVVQPRRGAGVRTDNLLAANGVADLCGLTVMPIESVVSQLPKQAGRTVRGGSLWRAEDADGGDPGHRTVMLANETTVTSIVSDRADDARLARFVESVRVELR
jgi:hypothetical protein